MTFFGIILGIAMSVCLSFMITMIIVCKSNDMGDSKGTFYSFAGTNVRMLSKKDGVNPKRWQQ